MKKKRFTEEIAYAMRQHESGMKAAEICRKMGISSATFYTWKKKYSGLGVAELREMKRLRDENAKLKRLVADLSLDKHVLQEVIAKSCAEAPARRRNWRGGRGEPADR